PVVTLEYNPDNLLSLSDLERELPAHDSKPQKPILAPSADHSVIQQECPWYGHYTGDGAAAADEPNWYATASITARCKDGDQVFRDYSARHPRYDERVADKKLRRALEEAGPRTCESICSELG